MQARMAYCGPRGIPLSEFLSWREDDQQAALAWQARESRRCGDCGTHPDDWNPAEGGSRDAYKAQIHICEGCVELQRLRESPELQGSIRGVHLQLSRR